MCRRMRSIYKRKRKKSKMVSDSNLRPGAAGWTAKVFLDILSHITVMAAWETRNVLSGGFLTSVDR